MAEVVKWDGEVQMMTRTFSCVVCKEKIIHYCKETFKPREAEEESWFECAECRGTCEKKDCAGC